jgi:hypothetical protein
MNATDIIKEALREYVGDGDGADLEVLECYTREIRKEERAAAFDEGMYALGDMIGVDPEWYARILRPSQEYL